MTKLITLFSDFGIGSLYNAEIQLTLLHNDPDIHFVPLISDAPAFQIEAAAYLLNAYQPRLPEYAITLAIVDPGVGTNRKGIALKADKQWFIGPDNGILDVVASHATATKWWDIQWHPDQVSASFHGRDVFAPVAIALANHQIPANLKPIINKKPKFTAPDLNKIIYIDHYGNLMTGIPADKLSCDPIITFKDYQLPFQQTFGDNEIKAPFWYRNSVDLVEIAVNQGCAHDFFKCQVGDEIEITKK